MCERHVALWQDTSVSLSYRSIRAESAVKTLHFSDLSLLHEENIIATFTIHIMILTLFAVELGP